MAKITVHVSDHALLRYIERRYNVPLDLLRKKILDKAIPAANAGASVIGFDGIKLLLSKPNQFNEVTIVTTVHRSKPLVPKRNERP